MPKPPKLVVLGATGQVGWELCRSLSVIGQVVPVSRSGVGPTRIDLVDAEALLALLEATQPQAIVNAAAHTAVDKAESETEQAYQLNAQLPEVLGAWAGKAGVPVIHYSTDYVFDGSKADAYTEQDSTAPLNVYGASKLAGEQALLGSDANAWILRVSWVYGARGNNFLRTMQRLMESRDQLNIVDDQIGAPTWSRNIADATAQLLGQILRSDSAPEPGLYHLPAGGQTSWFGFATAIRDALKLDCQLAPIPTSAYPTPATRPLNSRMDGSRLYQASGIALPDWQEALLACMSD